MRLFQLILIALFLGSAANAETSEECEQLMKAQAEIAQLMVHLKAAEAAADPDARIHFRYDWLRRDLGRVRRGIQAHIDAEQRQRDERQPVPGDYRR